MRRWIVGSLLLGVLGAALTVVGWVAQPQRTAYAYLAAFLYVFTLAVGALMMVLIGYGANARWFVALRRIAEGMAGTLPLLVLLFVPVYLARAELYPWVDRIDTLDHHARQLVLAKRGWLNEVAFGLRAALYFLVLLIFGELLRTGSIQEDRGADPDKQYAKLQKIALGGLVAVPLALTFAAFDWGMSLEPAWFSNVYGVYYFAAGFLAALSAIALSSIVLRRRGLLPAQVGAEHLHAIGRLMLAHTIFWAYIAFVQYLLVWIADMPEEVPFYIHRTSAGWYGPMLVLILGHFALPFFLLLMRPLKRNPVQLASVAIWILVMHYADMYWLVLPALLPEGIQPSWVDLTSLAALLGLTLAFGLWRGSRVSAYPLHDPLLERSLRYEAQS